MCMVHLGYGAWLCWCRVQHADLWCVCACVQAASAVAGTEVVVVKVHQALLSKTKMRVTLRVGSEEGARRLSDTSVGGFAVKVVAVAASDDAPGSQSVASGASGSQSVASGAAGSQSVASGARKKLDMSKFTARQLRAYMEQLFKIGDKDGNGTLDKSELKALLGWSGFSFDVSSVDEVLQTCDKNGDGVIDFEEFVDLMTTYCTADAVGADGLGVVVQCVVAGAIDSLDEGAFAKVWLFGCVCLPLAGCVCA